MCLTKTLWPLCDVASSLQIRLPNAPFLFGEKRNTVIISTFGTCGIHAKWNKMTEFSSVIRGKRNVIGFLRQLTAKTSPPHFSKVRQCEAISAEGGVGEGGLKPRWQTCNKREHILYLASLVGPKLVKRDMWSLSVSQPEKNSKKQKTLLTFFFRSKLRRFFPISFWFAGTVQSVTVSYANCLQTSRRVWSLPSWTAVKLFAQADESLCAGNACVFLCARVYSASPQCVTGALVTPADGAFVCNYVCRGASARIFKRRPCLGAFYSQFSKH